MAAGCLVAATGPAAVAARRAERLRALSETLRARFARGFWGRELDLLTLGETRGGYTRALSGNFLDVWLEGEWPPNLRLRARARPGAASRRRGGAAGPAGRRRDS